MSARGQLSRRIGEVLQRKVDCAAWDLEDPVSAWVRPVGIFIWPYLGTCSFVVIVGVPTSLMTNDRELLGSLIGNADVTDGMFWEFVRLAASWPPIKFFVEHPALWVKYVP